VAIIPDALMLARVEVCAIGFVVIIPSGLFRGAADIIGGCRISLV
jgi:hypothetical protein